MPEILIIFPESEKEWSLYYDLRYEVLREPLGYVRGTEKDATDLDSIHVLITDIDRTFAYSVARLHFTDTKTIQIRYMAVAFSEQGTGVGTKMMNFLEKIAKEKGAQKCILNARKSAIGFYEKLGYSCIPGGENISVAIPHCKMEKNII